MSSTDPPPSQTELPPKKPALVWDSLFGLVTWLVAVVFGEKVAGVARHMMENCAIVLIVSVGFVLCVRTVETAIHWAHPESKEDPFLKSWIERIHQGELIISIALLAGTAILTLLFVLAKEPLERYNELTSKADTEEGET
jgi:ABC-type nickel/cobalt efflux system permease component RcnA